MPIAAPTSAARSTMTTAFCFRRMPTRLRSGSSRGGALALFARPLPLFALTREVRDDADHPLHEHQLTAMMHLVLLDRQQVLESRLGVLTRRVGERLVEEVVRQRLEPRGDALAFGLELRDDAVLVERFPLLRRRG